MPDTKNYDPRAVFFPPVAVAALGNLEHCGPHIFRFAKGGHLYSLLKVAAFKAGISEEIDDAGPDIAVGSAP